MHFTAQAPAKIIITGEHAVVYKKPCIVTAVNCFAHTTIRPAFSSDICLTLFDFRQKAQSTIKALRILKERLLQSYHLCMQGQLSIREVLNKPAELFQFALISLIDTFQMELTKGLHIDVRSDIPIGCGMGSSAATIVSVIGALMKYLKLEIKEEWMHRLSVEAERLQHGFSSGVDSYVSLHGGCLKFQQAAAEKLTLPHFGFYIVNTGTPKSTTGDAVMHVAKLFKTSSIWSEFEALCLEIESALACENIAEFHSLIHKNHLLLERLEVVPEKVRSFIKKLNEAGFVAKICGAGAIAGDNAGVVLVLGEKPPSALCHEFGYSILELQAESGGVRFVS